MNSKFEHSRLACSTMRSKVTGDLSSLLMRDITSYSRRILTFQHVYVCLGGLWSRVCTLTHMRRLEVCKHVFCMCLTALVWCTVDWASRVLFLGSLRSGSDPRAWYDTIWCGSDPVLTQRALGAHPEQRRNITTDISHRWPLSTNKTVNNKEY